MSGMRHGKIGKTLVISEGLKATRARLVQLDRKDHRVKRVTLAIRETPERSIIAV